MELEHITDTPIDPEFFNKLKETLDGHWIKGSLNVEWPLDEWDLQAHDTFVTFCLLGAMAHISGINIDCNRLKEQQIVDMIPHGEKYVRILADIIKEQFPDIAKIISSAGFMGASSDTSLTYSFNDYASVAYNDVELILEKGHVRLQEIV